ncbi:hypothetical protein SAY87_032144 [Trapa incisa]|uniref:BHLH domain-containing protein n=1 Tax=Trapa incisa TaxID=236973 RepID=A0AAN7KQY5_9MYRT|nr:hypothetical protein SAY87_032144 [Trapa incisa]
MELSQNSLLEELLMEQIREIDWSAASSDGGGGGGGYVNYQQLGAHHHQWWNDFDPFDQNPSAAPSLTVAPPPPDHNPLLGLMASQESPDDQYYFHYPLLDPSPYTTCVQADVMEQRCTPAPPQCPFVDPSAASMVEDHQDPAAFSSSTTSSNSNRGCTVEAMEQLVENNSSNANLVSSKPCSGDHQGNSKKINSSVRAKKLEGQPSKNLMAERRRRKRLNDRLSMLRSIVPKISKMDRTSILGDTIDYLKELLERINKLKDEDMEVGTSPLSSMGLNPNGAPVKNSPKFDVERKDRDTRIDICCATRPGLLLSTVNTIEALGLEIQQCVISCFGDFSMQASCSEVMETTQLIDPEDIKQALCRNAGYGGRSL